jgi:hypothetical protein
MPIYLLKCPGCCGHEFQSLVLNGAKFPRFGFVPLAGAVRPSRSPKRPATSIRLKSRTVRDAFVVEVDWTGY